MSFKSGEIIIKGNKVTSINKDERANSEESLPSLSKEEIVFLLKVIQKHEFVGKDIEILYNTTLNLQKQYIHLSNKQIKNGRRVIYIRTINIKRN